MSSTASREESVKGFSTKTCLPASSAARARGKWVLVGVAITAAAWSDCVAWSDADSDRQVPQDLAGRLWDLVYMASHAIRTGRGSGDRLLFPLYRVPRDGRSTEPELVTLKLIVGPGDQGEPVVTITLSDED